MKKGRLGVYIHWPFCLSKCPYCDFNVYTTQAEDRARFLAGYLKALDSYAAQMDGERELVSVYFGGGTPSLMDPSEVQAIIDKVVSLWPSFAPDGLEITLEANPTSSEVQKFLDFKAAGVNRISLGVQSLRDDALKFLGRLHGADDVLKALDVTRNNFDRYNIDLIYDRPGQSLSDWEAELRETLPYAGGHISAYQLTIKQGTAFEKQVQRGQFTPQGENISADLFELTQDMLGAAGMPAYEVSNYGASGHESRHNLIYWDYDEYLGIGPGAHGRVIVDGRRYASIDHRKPKDWLCAVEGDNGTGADEWHSLSVEAAFEEGFIMGLRLYEGCSLPEIEAKTGGLAVDCIAMDKIPALVNEGLLHYDAKTGHIQCTRAGMMRHDALVSYLL